MMAEPNKINQNYSVPLKEYFERVLVEKDKALTAALASAKEAVQLAEANSQLWRNQANEWRAAMSDKDKTYITKSEHKAVTDRLEKIENLLSASGGRKQGISDGWGWLAGAIGLLLAIASYLK